MFALRGIAVSFSIFVVLYVAGSLVVCAVWRKVFGYGARHSAMRGADLLLALRVGPFVVAAGVTAVLAVPSFLLLEPRAADEPVGATAAILGLCGLAVMLTGLWKATAAMVGAWRMVERWSEDSQVVPRPQSQSDAVTVLRISNSAPPLTAAGILRPSVWLSRAAEFVLSERELEVALRHEAVHVRRRDNLRKLVLRVLAFPGMLELESCWREATEMAADDAAVTTASEALDLAAAVIKLSHLVPRDVPMELTTALVHSPAECVNARVERLIAWTERPLSAGSKYSLGYGLFAGAAVLITLGVTYSELLWRVHTATEWLVR